ncbi:MAG: hypothetical protein MJE68_00520, partial [Proteobacteria bacterium]|nr:hypothetical protein [Pseudomonadota bacterium]
AFTPECAMCQVAYHMLRNAPKFYPYVEQQLAETGESYESYVCNIYHGRVWGDDLVCAAFGDMWNLAISIVSPISKEPINLFHNKETPDVVIIANGGCWRLGEGACTHFSATTCNDTNFKIPGTEYTNLKIAMDKVPKTEPIVLADKKKARQLAVKEYLKESEETSLTLLRGVCRSINHLNGKIADMISGVDDLLEEKKRLEFRLQHLGVAADKIEEAGRMVEREYMTTQE